MRSTLHSYDIHIDRQDLPNHTFLLGNRGGFVLYLPTASNVRDRTAEAIKWFGASGIGRTFFEGFRIAVECNGEQITLDRHNQIEFIMELDAATRVYEVEGREIREHYFVPDGVQAVVMTLETDLPAVVEPEFDMRYYQAFNTDFSEYRAEQVPQGLAVSNRVRDVGATHETMEFYGLLGSVDNSVHVEMLPEDHRLITKAYLKDEMREKLIESVYKETQAHDPDEAPIWNEYSTQVYAPARLHPHGPVSFICAFGDSADEATQAFRQVQEHLAQLRAQKRENVVTLLETAQFETGNREVDTAYAHVLTRFNDALVARDATLHVAPEHREHYYAIFAGDKYFVDAWKRDENISLDALLVTNDFETAREILHDTWQFQDERTGRLPHIIRAGEPLVYYSSDGTLWALLRLFEYTRRSGDLTLLQEKMPMVEHFFAASMTFVQRGLLPSGGIIDEAYRWETWADTPYTPRDGFPVEIELLWLTVLADFLPFMRERNPSLADHMEISLQQGKQTFQAFECDGYLADRLAYDWQQDPILTLNGYIAFGLGYPLPAELAQSMVLQARDQLAGHRGCRSLAPRDWPSVLPSDFLDDPHCVQGKDMTSVGIFNYHRGIEWEWFNQFFVAGELRCGNADHAYRLYAHGQVCEAREEVGIGGLSELHDRRGQVGADFQAWSMAGFIESLHHFAGIEVDALRKEVRIAPSLPPQWPYLRSRSRVGTTRFTVEYDRPSPSEQHLAIRLLGRAPHDYTLHVGLPLPVGKRVHMATCNGTSMSPEAWTYEDRCVAGTDLRACISTPMQRNVEIEIKTARA
jgi:glycogen debranching enzyme